MNKNEGIEEFNWAKEFPKACDENGNFEGFDVVIGNPPYTYFRDIPKNERECRINNESIERNPQTVNRLTGYFYEMGLSKLFEKCSEPKESNTQIGLMFTRWLNKKSLGIEPVNIETFVKTKENAILKGGDDVLLSFAKEKFGYSKPKGLDFVGRFNGKYVLGETKFITAIGGNQNNSFRDVITTLTADFNGAISVGIIDGIPWLKNKSNFYNQITNEYMDLNIMSSLVLREFLYQL